MSEEPEQPKVIGFRTRSAWTPPVAATDVENPEVFIDTGAVELLEKTLKRLKTGEIHGVVLHWGELSPQSDINFVGAGISDACFESPQMFVGALAMSGMDINQICQEDFEDDDD